jgi:hypothetical protein
MSRQELAALSGVSFYRLGLIERGFVPASERERAMIAKALGADTIESVFPTAEKPAEQTAADVSPRYLPIDIVRAGGYNAAIVGPRELPDGTIQPSRTIELDVAGLKSLETRDGRRELRARLTRIYDAVNAAPGTDTEPATWEPRADNAIIR